MSCTSCTISTWKSIPHGNLLFSGHVFSLKNVYKQQDFFRFFYCKTVFEMSKIWQIDRLDVVLVKMRWTGVLECWRLSVHKDTLLMSFGYPRALSPGCGNDYKWRLDMSCRATPEVGNVQRLQRRIVLLSFRPAPTVLERYDLT